MGDIIEQISSSLVTGFQMIVQLKFGRIYVEFFEDISLINAHIDSTFSCS